MRKLLYIGQQQSAIEGLLADLLGSADGFSWERLHWDASHARLVSGSPELIVAAAAEPADRAIEFLAWLQDLVVEAPRLAVIPAACSEMVIANACSFLDDFVVEPVRAEELRHRILRLLARRTDPDPIASRLVAKLGPTQLIGASPVFARVLASLPKLAASGLPVLITGETGTGKELCARAIHQLSARRTYPFVAVDCSVIPGHLFENEMFGHARGAFTDARQDQRGLVAAAEGGTLLLDEIEALPPSVQAKLLRFLQERTYRPLGSERSSMADVKIIAASNEDLAAAVKDNRFRADLYYRLDVLHLRVPALRERAGDIPLLAQHSLDTVVIEGGCRARRFSPAALRKLARHEWRGNVRELCNSVRRAAVLSDNTVILPDDLVLAGATDESNRPAGSFRRERQLAIAAFEKNYVEQLLRENSGNVTRAAKDAGKERRAFGRLMKKYGIDREALKTSTARAS